MTKPRPLTCPNCLEERPRAAFVQVTAHEVQCPGALCATVFCPRCDHYRSVFDGLCGCPACERAARGFTQRWNAHLAAAHGGAPEQGR